jgi:pimeloyl-ACP methyl ester carboxylesterase
MIRSVPLALMSFAGLLASHGLSPARADDEVIGDLKRAAFFGAQIAPAAADDRRRAGADQDQGVAVREVFPDSSAAAAGFRAGDILLAVGGRKVSQPAQFVAAIAERKAGETLTVEFARDGKRSEKELTLKGRPIERSDAYDVIYSSVPSKGGRMRTILTRPRSGGKHPALFLIQGLGGFSVEFAPGAFPAYKALIDDFARRGYVTLRVDKPGQGDSEGGPTRDVDFETELDAYRQGLKALKRLDFVDAENVFIVGHSMGGIMGPLLAADDPVKGIAAYGTVAKTWQECMLENNRRQMALAGQAASEIDRRLREEEAIEHHLYAEGKTPEEIAAAHPELRGRLDESLAEGKYYAGRHYAFFRQLAGKNLAEAWEKFDGHALAVWGKSDFVTSGDDHALIARIVNHAHPGRGTYLALDGIDHGFYGASSPEESFGRSGQPGEPHPGFLDALRGWVAKRVDEPAKGR